MNIFAVSSQQELHKHAPPPTQKIGVHGWIILYMGWVLLNSNHIICLELNYVSMISFATQTVGLTHNNNYYYPARVVKTMLQKQL